MAYIGKVPTAVPLTTSDLADGIITSSKIADGTIATADIQDGAVTSVKTTGVGGVNTPSFFAYLGTADQSITNNTWTKVAVNNEIIDTGNMYDTSTYRFTPTEAGTYYVYGAIFGLQNNIYAAGCSIYKNGSFYTLGRDNVYSNTRAEVTCTASGHVVMNGSTDYVELYGHIDMSSGTPKFGGNDGTFNWGYQSYFGAYKIIE